MANFAPKHVREEGWGLSVANYATATHAAAVQTYPAVNDGVSCRGLYGVVWSYTGGTPAGGALTITDGANTVLSLDLPATATYGALIFPSPFVAAQGNAITVTLADAGAGIVGKVSGVGPFVTTSYPGGEPLGNDFDFGDPDNSGFLFAGVL